MKNYKQLKVWQKGKAIAVQTYRLTSVLKNHDAHIFTSQVTRAALSISSNIAEGSSRRSEKDYARFLEIALGSSFELETQLEVMAELSVASTEPIDEIVEMVNEVQRMLYGLMKTLG